MMKPFALALAALFVAAPLVRADDAPTFSSTDDASKKCGKGSPVLVVFTKDGSDHDKAARAALADKRLAKPIKDGAVAVRVDPGDEEEAKKLGVAAEKAECTVVLDGYGIECGKHDKAPSADAFSKLLTTAKDATAKKKKIEKAVETAVSRAEAAIKKEDTATACQQLVPAMEYEKTVPCESMTKARKLLDSLTEKGTALVTKAEEETGNGDYAKAHKHLAEANAGYPIPAVDEAAKQAKKALAEREAADQQMGK